MRQLCAYCEAFADLSIEIRDERVLKGQRMGACAKHACDLVADSVVVLSSALLEAAWFVR